MSILRVAGWALVVLALVIVGAEYTAFRETGVWRDLVIGQLWFDLSAPSLNLVQAVVQRYLYPPLWTDVIVVVLRWNAAATAFVLGAGLIALSMWRGRRPARPGPRRA